MIHGSPLCYLATPYTKYMGGDIERAFVDASKLAGKLIISGVAVYSPIAHCHSIAVHASIDPLDQKFWVSFDERMMEACQVLIVAEMDGWEQSSGVAHEIEFFRARNRPIFHLDPESFTMVRRPGSGRAA